MKVSMNGLKAQQQRIGPAINKAIDNVLQHQQFIMGPEVAACEQALAEFTGAKHVISCSSGTDALMMFLMTQSLQADDIVFVPNFTFTATAEVVALVGAKPYFIDVDPITFNMDPTSLQQGIDHCQQQGLTIKGIIPVDLFGLAADYHAIEAIAAKYHLWVLCDAAQSLGARYHGRSVGQWGMATATSFFPAKPLGCYGDGGAVFTDDDTLAAQMRSIRVHGKGKHKYDNVQIGLNARLDTLQAAILIEKLKIFPEEIAARQSLAQYYRDHLESVATCQFIPAHSSSAWAQFTCVLNQKTSRDAVMQSLKDKGVATAIYYPRTLDCQPAYRQYAVGDPTQTIGHQLSQRVLSLPMHPYITESERAYVVKSFLEVVQQLSVSETCV